MGVSTLCVLKMWEKKGMDDVCVYVFVCVCVYVCMDIST
jgi:hypothetical protein